MATGRKLLVGLGALLMAGCLALVVSFLIEWGSSPNLPGKPLDCMRADSQGQIKACREAER
jgi:hypothetical protein